MVRSSSSRYGATSKFIKELHFVYKDINNFAIILSPNILANHLERQPLEQNELYVKTVWIVHNIYASITLTF